jgi:hypothetical protein
MSAYTKIQEEAMGQAEDMKFPRLSARKELIPVALIRVRQAIEMTGADELLSPVLETLRVLDDLLEEDVNDLTQHYIAVGGKPKVRE